MSGLTGAEYTLIGTAVGAGLTQIGPVIGAIGDSRRRGRKVEAKRDNQREAKRKPLYMELIGQSGLTEDLLNQISRAIKREHSPPEDWYTRLEQLLFRIDGLIVQIRVDGSDRAKLVAEKLDIRVVKRGLTDEDLLGDASNYAVDAQNASRALRTARESLIGIAREEFGG